MESFLSFLPTLLSGGLTGLLGTGLSFLTNHFERKQRHAQELDLRRLDIELAREEAKGAERTAAIAAEAEAESSANAALAASYQDAASRLPVAGSRLLIFAEFVRTMTRPMGAWVFLGLAAAIYFTLAHGNDDLRQGIVHTVLYLTEVSWLWWFGTRPLRRAGGGK